MTSLLCAAFGLMAYGRLQQIKGLAAAICRQLAADESPTAALRSRNIARRWIENTDDGS
jgi:hypothetical protein